MGKGKVLLIIIILIVCGGLGYYFVVVQGANKELSKKMENASQDYFKKYMRTIETNSAYKVTLKELTEANQSGENYDLKGLENCNKEKTHSTITIDMSNGKITKTEVKLSC